MAIPDFQTLMLPTLQALADDQEHTLRDLTAAMAAAFRIPESEQRLLLPSGRQPILDNRVGWAVTYMRKAELIERSDRGKVRITAAGQSLLEGAPKTLSTRYLDEHYEPFRHFRQASRRPRSGSGGVSEESAQTPQERIQVSYLELRAALAQELLDQVKHGTPRFFEQLVVDLLVAMGYGGTADDAGRVVGGSGDGGVDGVIKEDKLGLDLIYLQAKRWEGSVGAKPLREFAGTLDDHRANKGVFITTSEFSAAARDYVARSPKRIICIDGLMLAELMIDHGIGVKEEQRYVIARLDSDYFGQ